MDDRAAHRIAQRLDALERELRRWKLMGCGALAALCLVTLAGAKGYDGQSEIRARSFSLVDANDQDRVVMAMGEDGSPTVVLYDRKGERRLALGMVLKGYKGKPELWLADEQGKVLWQGPRGR